MFCTFLGDFLVCVCGSMGDMTERFEKHIDTVLSLVLSHYEQSGRRFPWRDTDDPYSILVSEYMLQQTQADRVVPKYNNFLEKFPDVFSLASSGRKEVLGEWIGLGYNRRAVALHSAAKMLRDEYDGVVPSVMDALLTLPGVGKYTAGAVLAFAYNVPTVIVETNIRTVVLHHCVQDADLVGDDEISYSVRSLIRCALHCDISPRLFYSAMMDYGSHLKRSGVQVNARSRHYTKQSRFDGSVRQSRGALLRLFLAANTGISKERMERLGFQRITEGLLGLIADGLVEKRGAYYYLVDSPNDSLGV